MRSFLTGDNTGHEAGVLIQKSIPLEKKFAALAVRYLDSEDKDVRNLATALLTHFERFSTFLSHHGVEPTNNSTERALRCAVQWRKTSFGSRSKRALVECKNGSRPVSHRRDPITPQC
jgi:hypothetical protein